MKNRVISLALILAMLSFPCLAFALELPAPLSPSPAAADAAEKYPWMTASSTVYVPVKRYQRVGDGWSEPQTYYPAIGHVEYKYWYEMDEQYLTWQGGCEISNTYPRPYAMTGGQAELLEPVFAKVTFPSGNFRTSFAENGFEISVLGGSFSVTYNSSLYYNTDGTLDHVERTTMMRSHNWSFTGP